MKTRSRTISAGKRSAPPVDCAVLPDASILHAAKRRLRSGILAASFATTGWAVPTERPSILVLLTADRGIGDLSYLNPKSTWKTTALHRLASEGRIFSDAHSASGVCTPSQYALFAGSYPWRRPPKRGLGP